MTERSPKFQRYLDDLHRIFGVDVELLASWLSSGKWGINHKRSLRQVLGSYEPHPDNNRKVLEALYRRELRSVRQLNAQCGTHDETEGDLERAHNRFRDGYKEEIQKYWPDFPKDVRTP